MCWIFELLYNAFCLPGLRFFPCDLLILIMTALSPDLMIMYRDCLHIILELCTLHSITFHFSRVYFNMTNLFSYLIRFYISQKNNSHASFIHTLVTRWICNWGPCRHSHSGCVWCYSLPIRLIYKCSHPSRHKHWGLLHSCRAARASLYLRPRTS